MKKFVRDPVFRHITGETTSNINYPTIKSNVMSPSAILATFNMSFEIYAFQNGFFSPMMLNCTYDNKNKIITTFYLFLVAYNKKKQSFGYFFLLFHVVYVVALSGSISYLNNIKIYLPTTNNVAVVWRHFFFGSPYNYHVLHI